MVGRILFFLCLGASHLFGNTYYISSSTGDDNNSGTSIENAYLTLAKINAVQLQSGDTILLRKDDTFKGSLELRNESGSLLNPIVISSYGLGDQAIIDGDGHLSSILISNCNYIKISDLEIKNDGGPSKSGVSTKLRYGMYVENTFNDGTVLNYFRFTNLTFKNIYPTDQITDDDGTGVNAYAIRTSGSWGDEEFPTRFDDMLIENCQFTRTGRHAVVLTAINNLRIKNNLFEHVGGAGMVVGNNSSNILVENNITNYTGSNIDSRMAARGSGFWAFRTTNLTVQHNKFMHARGVKDSHGMHIDIGNRNVVYQYNYSEDNEGGFVEILGANVNVGYRYNISVGDGWRSRPPQLGRIFWVGGWSGDPANPVGSDSVFIYNNSVYIPDSIAPRIWIEGVTKNTRIYNNTVYVANDFSDVRIKNDPDYNDFDYNIWFGNIADVDTDGDSYRGANSMVADPLYRDHVVANPDGISLQEASPAIQSGKLIYNPNISHPFDGFHNHGGKDFFAYPVSFTERPNIGAANGGLINNVLEISNQDFSLYPNPLQRGDSLFIELPPTIHTSSIIIEVIDASGKIVKAYHFEGENKFTLNNLNFPSGIYQLKVIAGNYKVVKQLIVIK